MKGSSTTRAGSVGCNGIRTALAPSFSMKRAVLPDTLEKYTRRGAAVTRPATASRCATAAAMALRESRGELVDLVGTEARPVVLIGDDDRRLEVPQRLDLLEGRRVLGKVVDLVFDAL